MDSQVQSQHASIEVGAAGESWDESLRHVATLERSQLQMEIKLAHLIRENRSLKRLMTEVSKDFEGEVLLLEAKSAELTKANDRMKLAEQVARFGIWEANYTTQTITISKGMKALLRLPADAPQEMSLAAWNSLLDREYVDQVTDAFAEATEKKDSDAELRVTLPDGTTRWHRIRAQGEFVNGQLVQKIGATTDVTAEREILNSLRAVEAALQSEKQELMDARERLREQATHDGLTHLWNRPAILEILEHELERGMRDGHATGLVMLDIDHFKRINDTYGHQAGDAVLCEVTRRLSSVIRPYDSLGRYGGEEFLLVIPNCCFDRDDSRLETLRLAVASTPVLTGEVALAMTCSFGAVNSAPGSTTVHDLVRLADTALYRAKALGRNRVEVHKRAATLLSVTA